MRKQHPVSLFLFALGIFVFAVPLVCPAASKVQECQKRPDFLSRSKYSGIKNMESLPRLVFVAREADFYVENKNQSFKIWGQQSFTRVESKIICANVSAIGMLYESLRFSVYAPTLMDLTGDQKVGDSFWQFHLNVDGSQLGIWNQKTRLFSKVKEFEAQMLKMGVQVQIFQISRDEFELVMKRESSSFVEALSVRFEAVAEIH